jgi:hypothetical protein
VGEWTEVGPNSVDGRKVIFRETVFTAWKYNYDNESDFWSLPGQYILLNRIG